MVRTARFAAMALAFAPFAFVASAQAKADAAASDAQTLEVRYDDLNLTTNRGIALLDARIARAANEVCGSADIRDITASRIVRACKRNAIRGTADARRLAIAASDTRLAMRTR